MYKIRMESSNISYVKNRLLQRIKVKEIAFSTEYWSQFASE